MRTLLGFIIGLIVGAIADEARGAFFGALVGGLLGYLLGEIAALKSRAKTASVDQQIEHIYRALGDIHLRLAALEQRATVAAPGESAIAPPAEPTPVPEPSAAATPAPETAAAREAAPAAGVEPPAPAAPASEAPALAGAPPVAAGGIGAYVRDWFTGGNALVRVGVIVLLFGVAFLFKYAAEHAYLPIEFRLIGVAFGAIVLLVIGWHLRERRRGFSIAVQGGGVGMLYLIVFASLHLYHVLPPGAAFILLLAIVIFSAILAVLQDALALAALGITGGFLAPILTATQSGDHVMLFAYYTLLNAGILGIAWFRAWRVLNLLGFAFTAIVGTLWATQRYRADLLASTDPFVVMFFLFYLIIAVLYALRQSLELRRVVDGTIVFGTPLVAFGWQAGLLYDSRFSLAASALAASALYLTLGRWLLARRRPELRLLIESFVALGIVFATLAIPLALDARWTSAAWALEGAAIVWIGVRQQRLLARLFGMLLQLAAGVAFASIMERLGQAQALFNPFYLGCVFLAAGGLVIAWLLARGGDRLRPWESIVGYALFAWGLGWWLVGGASQIERFVAYRYRPMSLLSFIAGTGLALSVLAQVARWRIARLPALAVPFVLLLTAPVSAAFLVHPSADGGWIGWPFAFFVQYVLLKRHEDEAPPFVALSHCITLWVATGVLAWEAAWQIAQGVGAGAWTIVAWGLVPTLVLALLTARRPVLRWPLERHGMTYRGYASGVLVAYLMLWTLVANFASDGGAAPLPYLPLLNPLDIVIGYALMIILVWRAHVRELAAAAADPELWQALAIALCALGFVWLNGILLRSLHHWLTVPYELDALLRSMVVQAALSVFWSVLALATMLFAVRRAQRGAWIAGGVLLAVVVVKLFLLDLSHISGIERIVSFLGVGVLLLVIGYFAPVPPRRASAQREGTA